MTKLHDPGPLEASPNGGAAGPGGGGEPGKESSADEGLVNFSLFGDWTSWSSALVLVALLPIHGRLFVADGGDCRSCAAGQHRPLAAAVFCGFAGGADPALEFLQVWLIGRGTRRPTAEEQAVLEPAFEDVLSRLGRGSKRRYRLRVIDDDNLNAAAGGGSLVMVTTRAVHTLPDDQLKAVLAHELGHHAGLQPAGVARPRMDVPSNLDRRMAVGEAPQRARVDHRPADALGPVPVSDGRCPLLEVDAAHPGPRAEASEPHLGVFWEKGRIPRRRHGRRLGGMAKASSRPFEPSKAPSKPNRSPPGWAHGSPTSKAPTHPPQNESNESERPWPQAELPMTISAHPRLGWLVAASGDRLLAETGTGPTSQPNRVLGPGGSLAAGKRN